MCGLCIRRRENYAKMHKDVVRGPPPRVTSGNYCARNTIIAEPTPRYTTITTSDGRTRKSIPRNTVLAEPTPRVDKWNRGTMPETSARLVDIVRKDEVVPTKFVGNEVVPSPTTATVVESGQMKWSGNYQTTALAQSIHASNTVLSGMRLLEQLRPPPQPTYQRAYFQPQTSMARYRPEELELAVKATLKRKPRTETKAGIPPGAVSSRRHFI